MHQAGIFVLGLTVFIVDVLNKMDSVGRTT